MPGFDSGISSVSHIPYASLDLKSRREIVRRGEGNSVVSP
jgi:hypothetical protein